MLTTVASVCILPPGTSPPHGLRPCPDCEALPDFGGYYRCRAKGALLRRLSVRAGHLIRFPRPAVATDARLWRRYGSGVAWYVVVARDEGWTRWVTAADFDKRAERLDRGWGLQLALDLSQWRYQGQEPFRFDDKGLPGLSVAP